MKINILISVIVILFSSCTSDKNESIEHYMKSKILFQDNDFKNALYEIEIAIKNDSLSIDNKILHADILGAIGEYEKAIEILESVIIHNYKLDTVYYKLSYMYKETSLNYLNTNSDYGDWMYLERALTYANLAIKSNSQYYNAYVIKWTILHNSEKYEEALAHLNIAYKIFPDSVELISCRGIEKLQLGDLAGAIHDLDETIKVNKLSDSKMANNYRFRAQIHQKNGDIDKAISDLSESIKLDSTGSYYWRERANCYRLKGLKSQACYDYRKAADLGLIKIYEIIKSYCEN